MPSIRPCAALAACGKLKAQEGVTVLQRIAQFFRIQPSAPRPVPPPSKRTLPHADSWERLARGRRGIALRGNRTGALVCVLDALRPKARSGAVLL